LPKRESQGKANGSSVAVCWERGQGVSIVDNTVTNLRNGTLNGQLKSRVKKGDQVRLELDVLPTGRAIFTCRRRSAGEAAWGEAMHCANDAQYVELRVADPLCFVVGTDMYRNGKSNPTVAKVTVKRASETPLALLRPAIWPELRTTFSSQLVELRLRGNGRWPEEAVELLTEALKQDSCQLAVLDRRGSPLTTADAKLLLGEDKASAKLIAHSVEELDLSDMALFLSKSNSSTVGELENGVVDMLCNFMTKSTVLRKLSLNSAGLRGTLDGEGRTTEAAVEKLGKALAEAAKEVELSLQHNELLDDDVATLWSASNGPFTKHKLDLSYNGLFKEVSKDKEAGKEKREAGWKFSPVCLAGVDCREVDFATTYKELADGGLRAAKNLFKAKNLQVLDARHFAEASFKDADLDREPDEQIRPWVMHTDLAVTTLTSERIDESCKTAKTVTVHMPCEQKTPMCNSCLSVVTVGATETGLLLVAVEFSEEAGADQDQFFGVMSAEVAPTPDSRHSYDHCADHCGVWDSRTSLGKLRGSKVWLALDMEKRTVTFSRTSADGKTLSRGNEGDADGGESYTGSRPVPKTGALTVCIALYQNIATVRGLRYIPKAKVEEQSAAA